VIPVNPASLARSFWAEGLWLAEGHSQAIDMVTSSAIRRPQARSPTRRLTSNKAEGDLMQLSVRNDEAAAKRRLPGSRCHEPLSEDGIWQALGRMGLGWRALGHHLVKKQALHESGKMQSLGWARAGDIDLPQAQPSFPQETRASE